MKTDLSLLVEMFNYTVRCCGPIGTLTGAATLYVEAGPSSQAERLASIIADNVRLAMKDRFGVRTTYGLWSKMWHCYDSHGAGIRTIPAGNIVTATDAWLALWRELNDKNRVVEAPPTRTYVFDPCSGIVATADTLVRCPHHMADTVSKIIKLKTDVEQLEKQRDSVRTRQHAETVSLNRLCAEIGTKTDELRGLVIK